MNMSLFNHSMKIILQNQGKIGGYIASPFFRQYQYCWFRDGSFIAYAMDMAGQVESSSRFYQWSAGILQMYQMKISRCIQKVRIGSNLTQEDYFHCRYQLDGKEANGNWGDHQLDGLGLWLWAYCRHFELNNKEQRFLINREILFLARDYLAALWQYPCYDCWEENIDLHAYTLAAISAGLGSLGSLLNDEKSHDISEEIKSFLLNEFVHEGILYKSKRQNIVDASLIGLTIPFSILPMNNPIIVQTIARIVEDTGFNGVGLHRYYRDQYYGGGIWILLSAWLGWYYAEAGNTRQAMEILHWIEKQTNLDGELPEQICEDLYSVEECSQWKTRWGEPASPLLWSHAMYMLLYLSLKEHGYL